MKPFTKLFTLAALFILAGTFLLAPRVVGKTSFAPVAVTTEDADSEAIRRAALDYAESWYEGDPDKMERALHPELAKRIVHNDPKSGRSQLDQMGALRLVQSVKAGYGKKTPREKQLKDVVILDRFENVATVKLTMSGWIDYMHLAKWNGKWVIVNVLWEMKPEAAK
jgi:hypothetical protein